MFRSAPPHGGRRPQVRASNTFKRFDPRPRTGGDGIRAARAYLAQAFRSAPPHGGRHGRENGLADGDCFDPRPRTGGDGAVANAGGAGRCFDPRPRTGGDATSWRRLLKRTCFDPRPRTGGDGGHPARPRPPDEVSIRAPARGATRLAAAGLRLSPAGFDPRPRTGGDSRHTCRNGDRGRFDPRPRTGGDLWIGMLAIMHEAVSIRAPARGATALAGEVVQRFEFRSAPPHGGRRSAGAWLLSLLLFRSAPPHGGRRVAGRRVYGQDGVSIRAPARGATFGVG